MKNSQIVSFWHSGASAKSKNGNFRTDGIDLYSYKLRIGYTDGYGQKVLYNYTSEPNGRYVSSTTTSHVNLAKFYADILVDFNDP